MTADTDTVCSTAAEQALRDCWGLASEGTPRRLHGGAESVAFAIGAHVIRLGPRWRTSDEAEWCHTAAVHAAAQVPEALAPLPTGDGATIVRVGDRPMSVWPLVAGSWPEPTSAGVPELAAGLLARLHRALASLRRPQRPVPAFFTHGIDGGAPPADPRLRDPDLDRWLAEFHRTRQRRQPVHGDFHPGNTLAEDGTIVTVLDWDEVCVAAPEAEVASAALEWASDLADDMAAMRSFVRAYAAADGPAGLLDQETLIQFVRHRLRREAAYFTLAGDRGTVHDEDATAYHEQRITAFTELRP